MSNLLITIGDSFTYGEGLQFHLWKTRYSNSYSNFHQKIQYEPCQTISSTFDEFNLFRKTHNYTGVLSKFLNIPYVTNSGNGGSNYSSLDTLDIWIDYLKLEKSITPTLCIFQFTNVIRDIFHVQSVYRNSGGIYGEDFYDEIKFVIAKLNTISSHSAEDTKTINAVLIKCFNIMLLEVKKRFRILEELGCKCIYFIGSAEYESAPLITQSIINDTYNFPIIYGGTQYDSWDMMNRKNKWTLRESINVNDDHPCIDSHQWLAHNLYQKYLEISK